MFCSVMVHDTKASLPSLHLLRAVALGTTIALSLSALLWACLRRSPAAYVLVQQCRIGACLLKEIVSVDSL